MNTMNENAKDQQRLGQLKNLVMLASADERLTDSELAVLLAVASRENITPEEFNNGTLALGLWSRLILNTYYIMYPN